MKLATLLLASITVLAGTGADGATVTFTLVNNWDHDPDTGTNGYAPGRWSLYGTASQGDNLGMSRWGVVVTGWETRQNVSPQAIYFNPLRTGGFDSLRNPPGDTIEVAGTPGMGSQLSGVVPVQEMVLVFGFGQSAASMTAATPPGSVIFSAIQDHFGLPVSPIPLNGTGSFLSLPMGTLLLARGSYSANRPVDFDTQDVNNVAGVYANASGNTMAADIMFHFVIAVPEPRTVVLAVFAAAFALRYLREMQRA